MTILCSLRHAQSSVQKNKRELLNPVNNVPYFYPLPLTLSSTHFSSISQERPLSFRETKFSRNSQERPLCLPPMVPLLLLFIWDAAPIIQLGPIPIERRGAKVMQLSSNVPTSPYSTQRPI